VDEGGPGRGDFEVLEELRTEQLVHQNAPVLGIVAELDDVPAAVIGLQQMRLGASSHSSNVPDGGERHRKGNRVP